MSAQLILTFSAPLHLVAQRGRFTLHFTPTPTAGRLMNPFTEPLPGEVPLPAAPLVRVLCQVRFPQVLSVESEVFVAPFQETLRKTYPRLTREQAEGIMFGPTGPIAAKPQTAWRFHDLEGDWRVSLTPNFLAVETTKYSSRENFMRRLRDVLVAAEEHIQPAIADRVGIRYLDRLHGDALPKLATLVRPEVLGIAAGELKGNILHSLTESLFDSDAGQVLARWGRFPPAATMDPDFMAPIEGSSWVLDVDMFNKSGHSVPFKADELVDRARSYAERIYAFFRWCVTDEFLRHYGGKP